MNGGSRRAWTQPDRRQDRGLRWLVGDAVVAALFTWVTVVSLRSDAYVDMYGPVEGAGWLLALSPNAVLLLRRFVPVTALVVATALYLAASATQGDSNAPLAIPVFAYSVGYTRPVRVSGTVVGLAALAMSTTTFYGPGRPDALITVAWFMLFGVGWLVAVSIRRSQDRAEELGRTVEDLEEQQQAVARAAIADERRRIARELHDAVGHTVNVIVLQAGAARLTGQPDKALAALREIEGLGRDALTDLDHMLGLLEDSPGVPGETARRPVRTLADVPAMVEELRTAGADVTLHDHCDRPVGQLVGAAGYRIVQEALTNAIKHAGDARVEVDLACSDRALRIRVSDDGLGSRASRPAGGGRGIASMEERAKVLGGQLRARPIEPRGFLVEAVLPLTPPPARQAAPTAAPTLTGHQPGAAG